VTAWHVTQAHRLPEILANGLCPRDSSKWNFRHEHVNAGVEVVFVWLSWEGVQLWRKFYPGEVVLEVDIDGLPVTPDPYYADAEDAHKFAARVHEPIPPERLSIAFRPGTC